MGMFFVFLSSLKATFNYRENILTGHNQNDLEELDTENYYKSNKVKNSCQSIIDYINSEEEATQIDEKKKKSRTIIYNLCYNCLYGDNDLETAKILHFFKNSGIT